eukprot:SAG11_NODE_31535_length_291_cov_0.791667_1_plen_37_part_01
MNCTQTEIVKYRVQCVSNYESHTETTIRAAASAFDMF